MANNPQCVRLLIVLTVIFTVSCTKKSENSTSTISLTDTPEGSGIEKLLNNYYQTMSARNWTQYRDYFWPGATITTAWIQPGDSIETVDVTTIDDFIRETPMGPDSKPVFEEKMTDFRIEVQGDLAQAWVSYEATFGKPDSLMHWQGTDLFTLLRHNGNWKIVSLVFESKE
jgi:hypothetical protein